LPREKAGQQLHYSIRSDFRLIRISHESRAARMLFTTT
jgi:hypothetical protein